MNRQFAALDKLNMEQNLMIRRHIKKDEVVALINEFREMDGGIIEFPAELIVYTAYKSFLEKAGEPPCAKDHEGYRRIDPLRLKLFQRLSVNNDFWNDFAEKVYEKLVTGWAEYWFDRMAPNNTEEDLIAYLSAIRKTSEDSICAVAFRKHHVTGFEGEVIEEIHTIALRIAFDWVAELDTLSLTDFQELLGMRPSSQDFSWVLKRFEPTREVELLPKRPLPSSASPIKTNGLAVFASGLPAYGATQAIFAAHKGWDLDPSDGRHHFIKEAKGGRLQGRCIYSIIVPWDATADEVFASQEMESDIVKRMGRATADLHMLLLNYAADQTRRGDRSKAFCIPRKEIYRCLGLDKRTDLTRADKDAFAKEEIKIVRSIGVRICDLKLRGKGLDYSNVDTHPLWDLSINEFGRKRISEKNGVVMDVYEEWQLIGREGLWGEVFLHEKPLRQYGHMSWHLHQKINRKRCDLAALNTEILYQARIQMTSPLKIRNSVFMDFLGLNFATSDRLQRFEIRRQLIKAFDEIIEVGWTPDFRNWPSSLHPGSKANDYDIEKLPHCETLIYPSNQITKDILIANGGDIVDSDESTTMTADDFKALRKKLGMTQEQMGRYLGIDKSLISHIEKRRRPVRPEYAKALLTLKTEQ